jgi:putative salt-induced outer membrane protein YdiY
MALGRALAALVLVMVFSLHSAHADQIVLVNGDRLTGKVVSKSEDTLRYRTEYAGEIKVRWKDVVSITTDEPVTVMSADGELEAVRLERAGAGGAKLVSEGKSRDVPLADLAYINPPPHVAGTGVTYRGRVTVLASASRGNTDDARLYGEGELRARAKAYSYGIDFQAEQKEESGDTTAQNYWLGGRYNRVIDDQRFAYARTSLANDEFTDIRLRGTVGAGLGWNIFDTDKTHLSLLGGLEYVAVDRKTGDSGTYAALGWGVDYRQWVWADRLELFFNQTGFANPGDSKEASFRTRTGVRIPLGSNLSANAQVNYDYEGDPGPNRDKADAQVLLGLGYDF